ncbi:MAG: hypothetical protein H0V01_10780 [Bacteroidetes bacterium]|nr:hypothetical protein [Bacteroidota bacterium]HET6243846.1 hypothetical protein [Bacteroidia bacterium]
MKCFYIATIILFFSIISCDGIGKEEIKNEIEGKEKIKEILAQEKYPAEIKTNGDSLIVLFQYDAPDIHDVYITAYLENLTVKLSNQIITEFSGVLYKIIDSKQNKILASEYYDVDKVNVVNIKYKSPIYSSFMNYLVDSMSMEDVFNYNGSILALYQTTDETKYNRDFIFILDGFMQECIGKIAGDTNEDILRELIDMYKDPLFDDYPQATKHLQNFINMCENQRGKRM